MPFVLVLLVGADVLNTFDLSMAVLSLGASSAKSMFRITSIGEYTFERVSIRRIILFHVFVILPRLAVATMLAIPGALFLVYTAEIPDLILDAVALGFVLDMDEVIFQFLPYVVRAVIRRTVSFPLVYQPLRFRVGALVLAIFPAVAVVVSLLATEVVTRAQLAQDLICGGDTDFIFTLDAATGVAFAAPPVAVADLDWESFAFSAVLQKTTLDTTAMLQYLEVTQDGNAWSAYDVQLSLIDTSENVEAIAAATAAEALAALQCIDLDSSTAYLTRLREVKGDDSIQGCSELLSSCQETASRMFCPHTFECDTTLTGLYIRDSCSSSCDQHLLAELSAIDSSLFGVGETSAACASNDTSWMDTFLSQLQESLASAGDVTRNGFAYVWSPLFMENFAQWARGHYFFNVSGDVTKWIDTSVGDGACDAIDVFDTLFGTTLCESSASFTASRGSLQGLCPKVCGLCDSTAGATNTLLTPTSLYAKQARGPATGLFRFQLIGESVPSFLLSCDSNTSGSTSYGQQSLHGNGSPEMVYAFTSDIDQKVIFETCGSADFSTHIIIYDSPWNVLEENYHRYKSWYGPYDYWSCNGYDDNPWIYTSSLWPTLSAGQTVFILVEGADINDVGNFHLKVVCYGSV